jgi:hypothetical protein
MHSTHSPDAEDTSSVLRHQTHSVRNEGLTIAQQQNHRAQSWRRIAYTAVLLLVLFLGALAWMRRDFRNPEIPDWRPVLALADAAQEKGDLYYAKSLYSQVGRLAARREDWEGLVVAACAMNKLDKQKGRYSPTNGLLLRAMIAAETKQNRSGMAAVAKAFAGRGEDKVASMVLSRIQENWIVKPNDSANGVSPGC